MGIASDITALIGSTPCVRLNRLPLEKGCFAEVVAKLESFNPSASVKDRIASAMVLEAEAQGTIQPGRTLLVEPTSSRDSFLVDPLPLNFTVEMKRCCSAANDCCRPQKLSPKQASLS